MTTGRFRPSGEDDLDSRSERSDSHFGHGWSALVPAARAIPAPLAALPTVSGICPAVVAYEALARREARTRLRHPETDRRDAKRRL